MMGQHEKQQEIWAEPVNLGKLIPEDDPLRKNPKYPGDAAFQQARIDALKEGPLPGPITQYRNQAKTQGP